MDFFSQWNSWLGKRMFLLSVTALLLGFAVNIPDSPTLRILVMALFAYMTLITALETSLKKFVTVLSQPWVSLWVLFLAHLVTPLIAWTVGYLAFPEDVNIRLGYLICASIPVGVTSIIWTSLVGGNVAVSLVTVTLDTLFAPAFLPVFFMVAIGHAIHIDYVEMALQLLWMITIPSVTGMLLHDLTQGKVTAFAKGFGGFTAKIGFFLVIFFNATVVAPGIAWNLSVLKMALVTLFMVIVGYTIGYLGSFALKNRSAETTLAMIYNVGLRNISAGLVLALTHFPSQVVVPMALFILFQQPLASLVPYVFKRVEKCQGEG